MDQQTVINPPAAESISLAQGIRAAGSMTVQFTAFDNTRTAGMLTFTSSIQRAIRLPPESSAPIAPLILHSSYCKGADRQHDVRYFQSSDVGGAFLLKAALPVPGDDLLIAAFEVRLTNSSGTTTT
jgi:hypothetical protein